MNDKCDVRYVIVKDVKFIIELAASEETDVRNRFRDAATKLL